MAVETFQLRGRNYDEVVRQLVTTYNVSNGWAVVRVVNRLTSLDVILERNSEQEVSKDTSADASKDAVKAASKATPTEKVVEANEIASKDAVEDKPSATENPVAVKTTRKTSSKG